MTNNQLQDLARRLRTRAVLVLDADPDAAHDMLLASYICDDLRVTRMAVDAVLLEAGTARWSDERAPCCGQ